MTQIPGSAATSLDDLILLARGWTREAAYCRLLIRLPPHARFHIQSGQDLCLEVVGGLSPGSSHFDGRLEGEITLLPCALQAVTGVRLRIVMRLKVAAERMEIQTTRTRHRHLQLPVAPRFRPPEEVLPCFLI